MAGFIRPSEGAKLRSEVVQPSRVVQTASELALFDRDDAGSEQHTNAFQASRTDASASLLAQHRHAILKGLEDSRVLAVQGTGSTESGVLAKLLYDAGWAEGNRRIGVVESSSKNTIMCTRKLTQSLTRNGHTTLARLVGHEVQFDAQTSERTRIKFVSSETLLQTIRKDPILAEYNVLVVNDVHLRGLYTDLILALLKKVLEKRFDLRVVLLYHHPFVGLDTFADFFPSFKRVVLNAASTVFSESFFLSEPCFDFLIAAEETIFDIHRNKTHGDILCFVPTKHNVKTLVERLKYKGFLGKDKKRIDVFSGFAVTGSASPSTRRVFVTEATAEYSPIKLPFSADIISHIHVVDSGCENFHFFDMKGNVPRSVVSKISRTEADLRGRSAYFPQAPSTHISCYRLYTKDVYEGLAETVPQICKMDLASLVLILKYLRVQNIVNFDFVVTPPLKMLQIALEKLLSLRAINEKVKLTLGVGSFYVTFPAVSLELKAFLMSASKLGIEDVGVKIAAMLSVTSALFIPPRNSSSTKFKQFEEMKSQYQVSEGDHITLLNIFTAYVAAGQERQWAVENCLDAGALSRAVELAGILSNALGSDMHQTSIQTNWDVSALEDILDRQRERHDGDQNYHPEVCQVLLCLLSGFFVNVAVSGGDGAYYTLKGGVGLRLHRDSALHTRRPEWLLFTSTSDDDGTTYLRECSKISNPTWLPLIAPHYFETSGQGGGGGGGGGSGGPSVGAQARQAAGVTLAGRKRPAEEPAEGLLSAEERQRLRDKARASNWLDV